MKYIFKYNQVLIVGRLENGGRLALAIILSTALILFYSENNRVVELKIFSAIQSDGLLDQANRKIFT